MISSIKPSTRLNLYFSIKTREPNTIHIQAGRARLPVVLRNVRKKYGIDKFEQQPT
jgi:hypothetical protein